MNIIMEKCHYRKLSIWEHYLIYIKNTPVAGKQFCIVDSGTMSDTKLQIDQYDVIVVGLGPVGLLTYNLLGQQGHRVLGIEKTESTAFDFPRAIAQPAECMPQKGISRCSKLEPSKNHCCVGFRDINVNKILVASARMQSP